LRAVDGRLQAQVHLRARLGVEEVVALVLRVRHPEHLADVVAKRVNLQREVAALERVEHVEADRELGAEGLVDVMAEELLRVPVHEGERG
jgi:hypothetical protein